MTLFAIMLESVWFVRILQNVKLLRYSYRLELKICFVCENALKISEDCERTFVSVRVSNISKKYSGIVMILVRGNTFGRRLRGWSEGGGRSPGGRRIFENFQKLFKKIAKNALF